MGRRARPFNQGLFDEIIQRLAEGESLTKICQDEKMPSAGTFLSHWVDERTDDGRERSKEYARAKVVGVEGYVNQILDIAEDTSGDWIELDSGAKRFNPEHTQRSKLKIDSIKWIAGKLLPHLYGDLKRVEMSGPNGTPLQTVTASLPPDEAAKHYLELMR